MKMIDITDALVQKVVDTIYDEWKHEGNIQVEHTGDFLFSLDGRLYRVTIEDVGRDLPLTEKKAQP